MIRHWHTDQLRYTTMRRNGSTQRECPGFGEEDDFGLIRGLKWTLAGAAFWLALWWVLG